MALHCEELPKPAFTGAHDYAGDPRDPGDHAYEPQPFALEDAFEIGENPDAAVIEDARAYFAPFAAPIWRKFGSSRVMVCFHCGEDLSGMWAGLIGRGGFQWGLAHGEGHCAACHWPARAYHFVKDRHGADLMTIRPLILSYLPQPEAKAEAA